MPILPNFPQTQGGLLQPAMQHRFRIHFPNDPNNDLSQQVTYCKLNFMETKIQFGLNNPCLGNMLQIIIDYCINGIEFLEIEILDNNSNPTERLIAKNCKIISHETDLNYTSMSPITHSIICQCEQLIAL
jgi:hypothetical protein